MIKFKNIIQISVIVCCALFFQACPLKHTHPSFLELKNNSDDTLAVYVADGVHTAYPDTLLNNQGILSGGFPKEVSSIYPFTELEAIYKRLPKDTLSIFILDMNNNYGIKIDSLWKEMNYGTRFLRRYDMSIQDLRRLNLLLSYPPDERMRYMKMYPPYQQ